MQPLSFPQWNCSPHCFPIDAQVDGTTFGTWRGDGLSKERSNDPFNFLWLCTMSQDTAPRTGVRHLFSSEMRTGVPVHGLAVWPNEPCLDCYFARRVLPECQSSADSPMGSAPHADDDDLEWFVN